MQLNIEIKLAIITGSSEGIGKAIAKSFALSKCHVDLVARGQASFNTGANLRIDGGSVKTI